MENQKRTALITGATRGIGAAIAQDLGKLGFTVAATATTEAGAKTITQRLTEAGIDGAGMVLDVTNSASIADVISRIENDFGPVDVLVNNAGITKDNIIMRMKEDEWLDVIDTNLTAIFRLTKACVRSMVKQRWGRIVTISSVVGSMGNAGQCNYAATKAGAGGFSRALAKELGSRNITVNTVAPGFIDTDMTKDLPEEARKGMLAQIPLARLGWPAEVSEVVKFLVSESASYITGETIHVNGGMYMG